MNHEFLRTFGGEDTYHGGPAGGRRSTLGASLPPSEGGGLLAERRRGFPLAGRRANVSRPLDA